jgi:hypothetical protein
MDWDKGRSRNNGLEDQEDRAKNSGNGPGAGGLGHEEGAGRVARRWEDSSGQIRQNTALYDVFIPIAVGPGGLTEQRPSWEKKKKQH